MAQFNYDDMLSLAKGGTKPTSVDAPAKSSSSFNFDEMLSIAKTAPVVTQTPQATPIEKAVAQTYPEAKPERQEPTSLFGKYQKWSLDTGKAISESTAGKGVARGVVSLLQIAQGLSGLAYNALGFDVAAQDNFDNYVKAGKFNEEHFAPEIGTYKNVSSLGSAGTYALEKVTENIAMFIPSLVTGGFGGIAARKIAEKTVKQKVGQLVASGVEQKLAEKMIAKEIVKKVTLGSGVGAGASTIGMETGSIAGDIYQETGRIEPGTALAGGVPAGLLDVVPQIGILKRLFGPVGDEVVQSLVKKIGVNGAKQVLQEGGTEMAQTLIEIGAVSFESGKPVFSRETLDQIIDAGLGGGIAGGGLSVATDVLTSLRTARDTANTADVNSIKDGSKQELEKTGLAEDIRNAVETNGWMETQQQLVEQHGISSEQANRLIQSATTPAVPTQEEIAKELQATRDTVERQVRLQKETTEEIVSRVDEMLKADTINEIAELEDELKAIREELSKRKEPEAKLAEEAIRLLPAPKSTKLLSAPKDINEGDTVKIKTNATGVARDAEVVEVREDGIVATVKGDKNFPEIPMLYPVQHFTTIPKPPKEGTVSYADWKQREKDRMAKAREAEVAKVPEYREKAKQAENTPAIAEVFTRKADEIEGKKGKRQAEKENKAIISSHEKALMSLDYAKAKEIRSKVKDKELLAILEQNEKEMRDDESKFVPRTKSAQDVLNYMKGIPLGAEIKDPQGQVDAGFKLSKTLADVIGVESGANIFFTRRTLKHIAEKGELGQKLFDAVPEVIKNPTEIRKAKKEDRYIAIAEIALTRESPLTAVILEVKKEGDNIVVTVFPTDTNYIESFDLLWRTATGKHEASTVPPYAYPKKDAGGRADDFSAHRGGQKTQSEQIISPEVGEVNSVESLLKTHDETVAKLREGNITPQELQEAFGNMVARESDIKGWLNKMTIAELHKKFPSYWQRPGAKKADVVENAYDTMLAGYNPSDTVSYNMSESYSKALARYVSNVTPEQIAEYAKKVAERRAERIARLEEKKQAIVDPQTLDQFRVFIDVNGVDKLSTEQRIRYDALIADKVKADTEAKTQQKALVKGVNAGVSFELQQTKHTKTGADLYVVTMSSRVETETYRELVSAAKRLGGYYSSFKGAGAIPGFQFKTPEDAKTFMQAGQGETVDAGAKMEERAQEQKAKTTSKLSALADVVEERATEKLNADRKTNTAKRAREASGAEADARKDIQLARTMKNLASAIESGQAKYLDGISAKTHIEELELLVHRAKNAELLKQYPDYGEREKHKGEPITDETIANIKASDFLPQYRVENFRKDVLDVLREKKGWKLITNRYYRKMYDGTGGSLDYWTPASVKEADEVREMIRESRIGSHNVMLMNTEHYARLRAMGVINLPQLRAMIREYVTFRGDAVQADKAKELERSLIGAKVGFDFFPTPKAVADQMVQEAGVREGMKVLEPSAGNGNIAGAIRDAGATPDVIELSSQLREVLEAKGYNVVGQDFLEHTEGGYDAIVMNPPFSNNADIAHVKHAYDLLAPGGKLVSIVGEGAFFHSGKTETEFRDWLDTMGAQVEQLPPGTFQDTSLMATTGANGRMVVIEKPEVSFARKEVDEALRDEVAKGLSSLTSADFTVNGKIDYAMMQEVEYLLEGFNKAEDTEADIRRGADILAPLGKLKDFRQIDFAKKEGLTTKIIELLGTRESVSKQFIIDATKQQGISGAERDLILRMVADEGDKVNVQDFADKVRMELLPLNAKTKETGKNVVGGARFFGYSEVALRGDERGDIANYIETIYESPVKTSVGEIHFPGDTERYFAHARKEDLPPQGAKRGEKTFEFPVGTVRRILEIQSDLFQKGNLEREGGHWSFLQGYESFNDYAKRTGKTIEEVTKMREEELRALEPYRNTWQDRIIREEVRQAALDGKIKLQFPTGETAMKIEGLGSVTTWRGADGYVINYADMKPGVEVHMSQDFDSDDASWIITDVLGDGKFKAVQKDAGDFRVEDGVMQGFDDAGYEIDVPIPESIKETFDISGKVDTENPIFKFYEKEVAKYLRNKYDAKLFTDAQGVTWNEVTITPDMAGPVLAFRTSGDLHDAESGPLADPTWVRQVVAQFAERLGLDINVLFADKIYTGEKSRALFAMNGEKADVEAWAATLGKDIVFDKNGVPLYTPAHEVLHYIVNNLDQMAEDFGISRMELLTAQNGGKMPRSRAEEQRLGEELSHGFESAWQASQEGKAHGFKGVVGRFFDRLIAFVKQMLAIPRSNEEIIHQFYDKALYMRRRGARVTDRAYDLGRFETAPGVMNFGVRGTYARKGGLSEKDYDALPEDVQREIDAEMQMEDIMSGIDGAYEDGVAEDLLSGRRHIKTGTDMKSEAREGLGRGLYARIFRKDAVMALDEVVQEIRDQTGKEYTGSDLIEKINERQKARNEILATHKERRDMARKARAQQIAQAKTEADKVKVMRAIERDLTKRLLEKQATVQNMGQKMGASRFQKRTRERYGTENVDLPYQRVTKAGEQAKAEAYYDANKQRTIDIALGKEEAPSDVTQNAISVAVIQKAQAEGDSATVAQALPALSLRSTRFGQEISMLRDVFNDKDPVAYMSKLLSFRKLLIEKKYRPLFVGAKNAPTFEQVVEKKIEIARKKNVPKLKTLMEIKEQDFNDFINSLAC